MAKDGPEIITLLTHQSLHSHSLSTLMFTQRT